jgi:signal transduction histidine kinase
VLTFRYRLKHADGTWLWVEAIGTNLLGEPAVGAVVVNRRDITAEIDAHQLLEDRVAERTRQLESLFRADETLYSALRTDDVIQALVDTARHVLGVDHASVAVAPHLDESATNGARVRMRVPIVARGEVFAIFDVGYDNRHEFSDEERRLCTALARRAGLAMENARLFEAARGVAALEERQKLARELHDSVSQALYAISLNAAAANEVLEQDPSHAQGLMVDLLSLAEAGMAEMRALIFELRPESLESEGLVNALEKQVAALSARHHLEVSTVLSAEPQVAPPIKEAVYRIAQEALHNIARHAHARHVDVALDQPPGEIVLRISDDGRGFDSGASFPGHLGLRSMRERAAAIGAELEVQSAPSQGTRMIVRVPLTPPRDGHQVR